MMRPKLSDVNRIHAAIINITIKKMYQLFTYLHDVNSKKIYLIYNEHFYNCQVIELSNEMKYLNCIYLSVQIYAGEARAVFEERTLRA